MIRIGAVSYLNARPLVFGLEQGLDRSKFELSYDVPSVLASRMAADELDVALLPAVELARIPDLAIFPGLAIGSVGACRSVLLVSSVPLDDIRSVSLDPESRTSNALVQVLCREAWGITPRFEIGPRDLELALTEHDAVVRIGDKALFDELPAGLTVHDLGEAWTTLTHLPFVFAVWAARLSSVDRDVYQLLHDSKRAADLVLDVIADDYTYGGTQYPEIARKYLRESIRYRFGSQELAGLRRFLDSAARLGLIPSQFDLKIAFAAEARCGV
ncbi:MAG TPA: menaquinone biosynthesis protein [Candidatus Polarisedimenticolaceae bacterium]|nr:menaquinone biosynthesis protein [Candidatus Polarisedimenticolaceae bacterium]